MSKKFWQFRNDADGGAELLLYGDIADTSWWGDEVTPKQFAEDLAGLGDITALSVRVNSGGGDVFAAQTIGNMLERHKATVTAYIDGLCASAATIVACHCDKVVAANDSTYMIHPVRVGLRGYMDAETMKSWLSALETIRENIVSLYAKKTGREKDEVAGWMDATSWWTGAEAKEKGFVDQLVEGAQTVENRNGVLFVNSVSMGLRFEDTPFGKGGRKTDNAASSGSPAKTGDPVKNNEEDTRMENEIKTVDDLRKAYPDLVDQAEKAAAEAAVKAERERIQGIEDTALPGSEQLAAEAKFTKPMSVSDFAVAMVKNAKSQGASYLAQAKKDAEESGAEGVENDALEKPDEFMDAIKGLKKN